MECAGKSDVIEIVPGCLCQRAILAEPGHASVYEAAIDRSACVRTNTQAFHHAGSKTFDENIRAFNQPKDNVAALSALEINRDRPFASICNVKPRFTRRTEPAGFHSVDTQ